MAGADSDANGGGGWWGSWWQSAKEKTSEALEFMKRDLTEFSDTVQHDTYKAVSAAGGLVMDNLQSESTETAKSKMKEGVKHFWDGISKAVRIDPDDSDQCVYIHKTKPSGSAMFDRSQARLHYIQIDPETYINEPSGPQEQFEIWQQSFDIETKKGDISELLVSKVEVRALYTKLVPAAVSHSEFWKRYFYKLHQLQLDEARKKALMKRAEVENEPDSLSWDDDWSADEEGTDGSKLPSLTSVSSVVQEMTDSEYSKESEETVSSTGIIESGSGSEKNCISQQDHPPSSGDLRMERIEVNIADKHVVDTQNVSLPASTEGENKKVTAEPTSVKNKDLEIKENVTENIQNSQLKTVSELNPSSDNNCTKENVSLLAAIGNESTKAVGESKFSNDEVNVSELKICDDDTSISYVSKNSQPLNKMDKVEIADDVQCIKTEIDSDLNINDEKEKTMDTATSSTEQSNSVAENIETNKPLMSDNPACEILTVDTKCAPEVDIKTKVKGDMVVVGSERTSPSSESSTNKDGTSGSEEWEKDFDIDITEDDLKTFTDDDIKAATEMAQALTRTEGEDDWENWE